MAPGYAFHDIDLTTVSNARRHGVVNGHLYDEAHEELAAGLDTLRTAALAETAKRAIVARASAQRRLPCSSNGSEVLVRSAFGRAPPPGT